MFFLSFLLFPYSFIFYLHSLSSFLISFILPSYVIRSFSHLCFVHALSLPSIGGNLSLPSPSQRITGKRYKQAFYPHTIQLESDAAWTEVTKRQFTHVTATTPRRSYLAIPLRPGHPQHHHATIIANNLDNKNWVVACTASATPQKGGQPW